MTIIVALLFGLTIPITPIQILWINLITAVTLGISLAFEPTEEAAMRRPPRKRNDPLLSSNLVWHIVLVASLFLCGVYGAYFYAVHSGESMQLARTVAMNTMVVMEIFQLLFICNVIHLSFKLKAFCSKKSVWIVIMIVTVAQFAVTYLPPLQTGFAT